MKSSQKPISTNQYEQLCVKAVAGSLTTSEKKELNNWLNQSEGNRVYYESCKQVWQQTGLSLPPQTPDARTEWHQLARSLVIPSKKEKTERASWLRSLTEPLHGRTRFAFASIVFALAITVALIQFVFNAPKIQIVNTASAEKTCVRLPDGSEVWLNSESSLQYPKAFSGKERKIRLSGEAYFTVVQTANPFVVCTENARTLVLGTAFNVWARHQETRVIVKRGRVQLTRSSQDSIKVNLTKNQMSRIDRQKPAENPQIVNAEQKIGWMEGRLVFEKTPLSEILEEIARFYGVTITIANEALATETLTATYENISLSTVLQSLSLSCNTGYRVRSENQIDFGIPKEEPS
jgi:ferric-dicitrate binding protein FerR (iron transport regulator)